MPKAEELKQDLANVGLMLKLLKQTVPDHVSDELLLALDLAQDNQVVLELFAKSLTAKTK